MDSRVEASDPARAAPHGLAVAARKRGNSKTLAPRRHPFLYLEGSQASQPTSVRMSLYRKIIWRFVAIAVLPLLVFAVVGRWQTQMAVHDAAASELVSNATAAAALLDRERAAGVSALGALVELVSSDPSGEILTRLEERGSARGPGGFSHLSVVAAEASAPVTLGDPAADAGCRDGLYSSTVLIELPLEGGRGSLIAGYRPALDRSLHPDIELWAYDAQGRLVAATSCRAGPGLHAAVEVGAGSGPGSEQAFATAAVPSLGLTVVAGRSRALPAPLTDVFSSYWLFALGLAGATVLVFSALLRPVAGSLRDLTRAAEQVAQGDLRPWFPTPTDDEVGRLTLAFQNMTERLRIMVARADQSSRLAVLGKLSAYLAHEIRNPLSAVKMNLQRLERWRRADEIPERYGEAITISLREVDRLSTAVSNVLQLSPNQPQPRQGVSLHELITEVGKLLDRDFARRGVALRWDLSAEADRVLGVPGQLKSVIINLMLNALDAQPRGGKLLIRSALVTGPSQNSGPHLELRFKDHGSGVPPRIRDRIFEPFFSTKEGGSGIGLALVSQTVGDHGGDVYLEPSSRVDDGAEFVVRLPLAAVASPHVPGELEPQVAPWLLR